MRKNSGFTLLELMIVVAIVSILVGITIPNMSRWMTDAKLKNAARDLVANMRWAKVNAIKENKDWMISFNTENNTYSILSDPGVDDDWETDDDEVARLVKLENYRNTIKFNVDKEVVTKDATEDGKPLPDDGVSYTGNRVIFEPGGTVKKLGYVYLSNEVKTAYAVGTRSYSGVVSIKKWQGSNWSD